MAREHLQSDWLGFLAASGQQETYQRMTVDEKRAFVEGWEAACQTFATWHDGEQQLGSGLYTVHDMRQICAQARIDIDSNARRRGR